MSSFVPSWMIFESTPIDGMMNVSTVMNDPIDKMVATISGHVCRERRCSTATNG